MKFEQYKDRAIITVHSDGPRGPQGIQGPKGDKGDKGDTGEVTQEEFDQQKDAINLKVAKVEDDLVAHKEDYMAEVGEINAQLAETGQRIDSIDERTLFKIKNLINEGSKWVPLGGIFSQVDGKIVLTEDMTTSEHKLQLGIPASFVIAGHKYFFRVDAETDNSYMVFYNTLNTGTIAQVKYNKGDKGKIITLTSTTSTPTAFIRLYGIGGSYTGTGAQYKFDNVTVIDLTATFGIGNEPSVEEVDVLLSKYKGSWISEDTILNSREIFNELRRRTNKIEDAIDTGNLAKKLSSKSFVNGSGFYANITANPNRATTNIDNVITAKPNTTYGVKINSPHYKFAILEGTSSHGFVSDNNWQVSSYKFTTAPTTAYMQLMIAKYPTDGVFNLSEIDGLEIEIFENPKQISENKPGFYSTSKVRYFAHRGSSWRAPENTLPAVALAGTEKWFGVESDVQRTSDGVFILMHDTTVDRTTDGTGTVANMTHAQIQSLTVDFGSNIVGHPNTKVPTLEEYLLTCKKYGMVPMMDIPHLTKYEDLVALVNVLKKQGFEEQSIVISHNLDVIRTLRFITKKLYVCFITTTLNDHHLAQLEYLGNSGAGFNYTGGYTKEYIQGIHNKGLIAHTYTVNDETIKNELIANGIDSITSDTFYE